MASLKNFNEDISGELAGHSVVSLTKSILEKSRLKIATQALRNAEKVYFAGRYNNGCFAQLWL